MELIYFLLASFGLTNILVYGRIFNKIRPDHYFFHCPMCLGFWVGSFLFLMNGYTELYSFNYSILNFFLCGWISSGTSYILSMVVDDDGFKVGGQRCLYKENGH